MTQREQAPLLIPAAADALRSNNFDAIRLFMAMLVVWSHSFFIWSDSEDREPLSLLLGGVYNSGNLAVLAFFAISGFLIVLSFVRAASWRSFLSRRVRRIYPGYLVAVLLCSLVIVPAFSSRSVGDIRPAEWGGIASNLLLRGYILPSDAFNGGAVNGSLWSIGYEFWCYIGVMVLGVSGLLKRRWIVPALTVGVIVVRIWLDATGRRPGGGWIGTIIGFPYFWFNVLPPFMLGAATYLYRQHIPRDRRLLLGGIALVILCAHLPIADPWRAIVTRCAFPPVLTYGIFYLAFTDAVRMPHAARYGDFSYGAYLYAFPIQQMLATGLRGKASFTVYVLLSMAGALAAGVLSWHVVERWFLQRVRRPRAPLQQEAAIVAP